jgi:hypothetical protein
MEVCVQVIWDGSQATRCVDSVDICDEVCRLEEMGTLQLRLF